MPPTTSHKKNPQATATVGTMKVSTTLKASQFPTDLVPMDGPAPPVELTIETENGPTLTATISSKNYRRAVRAVQVGMEGGADPTVVIQGTLEQDTVLSGVGISVAVPNLSEKKEG